MRVCVDAGILIRLVLRGAGRPLAVEMWQRWQEDGQVICAPTLIYYEVTNVFHRYAVSGQLLAEEAAAALNTVLRLDLELSEDADLHREALTMARRFRLPATYDAHYLALAARLSAELWTTDRRLQRAVAGVLPWVNLIESD